jgi:hypothetical protein
MSIDWILDLERSIDNGKEIFATQGTGRNEWIIGKPVAELKKVAKRAADHKKLPITIMRLIAKHDAIAGDLFLVPTQIDQPGPRGEPVIKWTAVETKEAAEMMRDVRHGPSPFFGIQSVETIEPEAAPG